MYSINVSREYLCFIYYLYLRHQNEIKRLEAELLGKAKIERENQDLTLERIRLKAVEHRETILKTRQF